MKRFFDELGYRIQQIMRYRYGADELSWVMMTVSLISFVLFAITQQTILLSFAFVLVVMTCMRCFSKNIYARRNELEKFYEVKGAIKKKADLLKMIWRDRKTYRYYRCKECKSILRVPKGKGKIEITCNKCKNKMIKKS